jgi:hypothetical protein
MHGGWLADKDGFFYNTSATSSKKNLEMTQTILQVSFLSDRFWHG